MALVVAGLISHDDEKSDEIGDAVTRGLPFTSLLELGAKLVKLPRFQGQVRDKFTKHSNELKTAMESRNHLLHGDWTKPGPGPATVTRTRAKGPVDRTFTVEQVEDVAFDLAVLTASLYIMFLIVDEIIDFGEWNPSQE